MGCDLEGGKNGERFGGEWVKKEINIVKRKVGGVLKRRKSGLMKGREGSGLGRRKGGMWIIGVCSIMV